MKSNATQATPACLRKSRSAIPGVGERAGRCTESRSPLRMARGSIVRLPAFAAHGLFAGPGTHEVWVRLSNASWDRAKDSIPDIRGVALKVFGVHGDSALGNGPAKTQDFTLINQEVFAFTGSDEFVGFVAAASHGYGGLLKYLFKRHGALGARCNCARG